MGPAGAHFRAHAHVDGLFSGNHPGGLPYWRFLFEHPYTALALLPAGHCFGPKVREECGDRPLISLMLPYSIAFMVVRIPMFVAWIWMNLPLGVEGPIYYQP